VNSSLSPGKLRSRITSVIFVVLLLTAAVVFRGPLVAWFTGKGVGELGAGDAKVASSASAGPTGMPALEGLEYPPPAFAALRSAIDAVERTRALLAADQIAGVADAATTTAQALRAAREAVPKARQDLTGRLSRAATHADELGAAKSVEPARKALAELNQQLLPVIGADARLRQELHVFECPMFEHARWAQRDAKPANPYMGTRMLTCANASSFQGPAVTGNPGTTSGEAGAIHHYTCSMHPSVKQQAPGKCPICGMDLVPVTHAQQEQGVVMIDEGRRQLIGVRTGTVIKGPMQRAFRAVGRVTYDESTLTDVTLKVGGFITKLFVSRTGQKVSAGQTLFRLYSPELFSAEQDFLLATQAGATPAGASSGPSRVDLLSRAARQRLHLLGLGEAQIDALAKRGVPSESIAFPAPASGFVIEKDVVEGASVQAGMRLFRIAALDKVWVEAEVYEADLRHVEVGQQATVTLDYLPGQAYEATVAYVYPFLEATARTGRVRVELANKALELRPGMYASVNLASSAEPRVQVPASAVVYTGPRRLVFVDLGEGRFRPQEIRVGSENGGMYEVLAGLEPGDRVATSGVFLLAAEARISTAATYWDKAPNEPAASDAKPREPTLRGGGP
jgi:membrane fusion protein, copper/silver efflux system